MRVEPVERILRECFRSFSPLPGAVLLEDSRVDGVITNVPITFFSGIAATRIERDEDVAEIASLFRARNAPFRWWLTPSARPHSLEALLQSIGMRHAYDAAGMSIDLASMNDIAAPRELSIRRITDAADMRHWTDVFLPVFSRDADEGAIWIDTYARLGFDDAWIHFTGFVDDRPAATTSLLLCGDLAGIYHVATLPSFRGRGFGAALTTFALQHARARGATTAVLQSSEMGFPVYRALGFEKICELRLYDWR
jgi:ribosomal protein S18 acetylase RimI-like enzyme